MNNPTREKTAILFQAERNIFLLDIPHSIALAQAQWLAPRQQLAGESSSETGKGTHNKKVSLLSCSPLEEPYLSTEPKKPAALAKLLETIPISERQFHSELILPLVRDSMETIKTGFSADRRWCFARAVPTEGFHDSQAHDQSLRKRRRGADYPFSQSTLDDYVSTQDEPPMILSTTSLNVFESSWDLGIVKNPSLEQAIIKIKDCACDETGSSQEFIVPPQSSFVLCTLPLSRAETDVSSTYNDYPIPGLSRHQRFNLILMDPPWPNRSVRRSRHYVTHHYSEMDVLTKGLRDILRVHSHRPHTKPGLGPSESPSEAQIQSQQSIAAIWITNAEKSRRAAYEALRGAGFCVSEEWVWVKTTWDGRPISELDGLWRKPYEILVIGCKDGHHVERDDDSPLSQADLTRMSEAITTRRVIAAVPDLHSRKPNLKAIFEQVFFTSGHTQSYSALEVFARNLTAGWWAAGNEVLRFNARECWVDSEN
ncbi:hypothetical protein N7457_006936 [Penicillium paradoxum]|uniref:uncharacterized protein n=1 Tax=Penicillium paradoxum TaxID=176176 RepID=UPI00254913C7|nr:uncharacterized protein N7457_006936 [Penicillium paradoxum]KAJ5779216.1 hypothetical protein N7457_006936 [Penicillium paradoxum]